MSVFFVEKLPAAGLFELTGPEGRHAATVRRLRVGEQLALTDGAGSWAVGPVTAVGKDRLSLELGVVTAEPAAEPSVTVVQALPKGDRSELAIELATEAGADAFVPWAASRCVVRWVGDKERKGAERWRHVAQEASKQSRRTRFPLVEPLCSTLQLVGRVQRLVASGGVALLLHESESTPIRAIELPAAGEVMLAVGPEGGLSPDEISQLTAAGAQAVRLGPEVLRTSTAAAVALGAIGVLTGRW